MKINSINSNTSFKAIGNYSPDAQTIRESVGSDSFLEIDKAIHTKRFKKLGNQNTIMNICSGTNNGDGVDNGIKLYLTEKIGDEYIHSDNANIDNSNRRNKITAKKVFQAAKKLLPQLTRDVKAYEIAQNYDKIQESVEGNRTARYVKVRDGEAIERNDGKIKE